MKAHVAICLIAVAILGLTQAAAPARFVNTTSCGGLLTAEEGLIEYKLDANYGDDERCIWTIRTPSRTGINFTMNRMGFEAPLDGVKLWRISKYGISQAHSFSDWTDIPEDAYVDSTVAIVTFHSVYTFHDVHEWDGQEKREIVRWISRQPRGTYRSITTDCVVTASDSKSIQFSGKEGSFFFNLCGDAVSCCKDIGTIKRGKGLFSCKGHVGVVACNEDVESSRRMFKSAIREILKTMFGSIPGYESNPFCWYRMLQCMVRRPITVKFNGCRLKIHATKKNLTIFYVVQNDKPSQPKKSKNCICGYPFCYGAKKSCKVEVCPRCEERIARGLSTQVPWTLLYDELDNTT